MYKYIALFILKSQFVHQCTHAVLHSYIHLFINSVIHVFIPCFITDQEQGPVEVELKKSPIEDSYHILEEIGRYKLSASLLTLKAPFTTAADNIHKYFFIVFQRK